MFDVVVSGGEVLDGSGAARFRADVGITRDRIAAVGNLAEAECATRIDASGRLVAPGFIDVHNHSDGWMLKSGGLDSKIAQGFTTEVLMADGISYAPVNDATALQWVYYLRALNGLQLSDYTGWQSVDEYLGRMHDRLRVNVAAHVPYANLRALALGFAPLPLDDFAARTVRGELRRSLQQGAVGLSTGLDYIVECHATTEELVHACRVVAEFDGLYVTHIRYKAGLIEGLAEAVDIARRSGCRLHVSHLKAFSSDTVEPLLEYLDRQVRPEVDFSFDVYPYQYSSTMLNYLLPYEVWSEGPWGVTGRMSRAGVRERFERGLAEFRLQPEQIRIAWVAGDENHCWLGRTLQEYADAMQVDVAEAVWRLLVEERLAVLVVLGSDADDALVEPFVAHDSGMVATDGIFCEGGHVHPRQFGSTGRVLGRYVRDRKLLTLEQAVYKLSGFPAARFRLEDRGQIREGAFADLVVLDPEHVGDPATLENPRQLTTGLDEVLVNGVPIRANGEFLHDVQPGRVLRAGDGAGDEGLREG